MLREVFNEFSWEDFTEQCTRKGKTRVEPQLPRLFAAPHKVLLRYFLVKSAHFIYIYMYFFFLFEQCQKVITQALRIVLTVSCHSLSFILTTSGIQPWIHEFSPFSSFLKEVGDGWVYQRIQPWIDFCFALSFASWLCQMQCVSHAVSLFREPWLGWLVSIQKQAKEDKILPSGLLRLQISN